MRGVWPKQPPPPSIPSHAPEMSTSLFIICFLKKQWDVSSLVLIPLDLAYLNTEVYYTKHLEITLDGIDKQIGRLGTY